MLFGQVVDIDFHELNLVLLGAADEVFRENWFLAMLGYELHVLHESVPDFFFDCILIWATSFFVFGTRVHSTITDNIAVLFRHPMLRNHVRLDFLRRTEGI